MRTTLETFRGTSLRSREAEAVVTLAESLRRHMRREDDVLYPLCERLFGFYQGPVSVLRGEHAAIERSLAILESIAEGGQGDRLQALEEVRRVLEGHLVQEERVLFPITSARLSPGEAERLSQRLQEIG